jgi:hypothetical protein
MEDYVPTKVSYFDQPLFYLPTAPPSDVDKIGRSLSPFKGSGHLEPIRWKVTLEHRSLVRIRTSFIGRTNSGRSRHGKVRHKGQPQTLDWDR